MCYPQLFTEEPSLSNALIESTTSTFIGVLAQKMKSFIIFKINRKTVYQINKNSFLLFSLLNIIKYKTLKCNNFFKITKTTSNHLKISYWKHIIMCSTNVLKTQLCQIENLILCDLKIIIGFDKLFKK
jgi:hypothetical protein